MAKGRIIRGGGFLEQLPQYEGNLKIAYGVGVVILIVLIYIVFFSSSSKTPETPSPSTTPSITPSMTPTSTSNTPSITTSPTNQITSKLDSKITDLKQKIGSLNNNTVLTIIKGKLEDWGDDINKLPQDVKEKAMACYRNTDGCIF